MSDRIYVLDPGHGGPVSDGCSNGDLREDDFVLDLCLCAQRLALAVGIKIGMTRTADAAIPFTARDAIAQNCGAALVISVHADSSTTRTACGVRAFHWRGNSRSSAVAREIVDAFPSELRVNGDRVIGLDIRSNSGYPRVANVLAAYRTSVVLVETCFLSNVDDVKFVRQQWTRDRLAAALLCGLLRADQVYA